MKTKIVTANCLEGVLTEIGTVIFEKLSSGKVVGEEKAFLLGHLNIISAIIDSQDEPVGKLNINYNTAKADFEECLKELEEEKKVEEKKAHQISFEEAYPGLFDSIVEAVTKKLKPSKPTKKGE